MLLSKGPRGLFVNTVLSRRGELAARMYFVRKRDLVSHCTKSEVSGELSSHSFSSRGRSGAGTDLRAKADFRVQS